MVSAICRSSAGLTGISTCRKVGLPKMSVPAGNGTRQSSPGPHSRPTMMVWTCTPSSLAICAASPGETLPALESPSVIRITTLLFASLSRRRLSDVARALPMAVPSAMAPVRTWERMSRSTSWSRVSGHCV